MPEQPALLPGPYKFPQFNPGVTLTSAPFRPSAQVVGDPRNVVKQLDLNAILNPPPPVAPVSNKLSPEQMRLRFGIDPMDNRFGGGRSGGYTTSTDKASGGWGRTSTGMRSSALGGGGSPGGMGRW